MTATLRFAREHHYAGDTIRLSVWLRDASGQALHAYAFLDTGASISTFDNGIAPLLGITDLTSGREVTLRVADSRATVGYVHDVRLSILGYELTIPVCFCPDWPVGTRNLLGMEGFLDQLTIALDHSDRRLYINRKR